MITDVMKKMVRDNSVCVLATSSEDSPHCSLMAYVTDDDCSCLYMTSHKSTRKYQNLIINPHAGILIDTREYDLGKGKSMVKALTIEGSFNDVLKGDEKKSVYGRFLDVHPDMKDFVEDPNVEFFSVKIKSFQLLDGIEKQYFELVG